MSTAGPRDYPFERRVATEPPPEYATLREEAPVTLVRMPTGDPAYLVTRYDDVRFVLSDRRFSVDRSRPGAPRLVGMQKNDTMLAKDPPDHTRLRRMMMREFTARRIERLRPLIREILGEILDAMQAQGPPADIVETVAVPLPITVLCELLGVPFADRSLLRDLSERMVSYTRYSFEEMAAARDRLREYVAELLRIKREEPGEDLLSALIAVRDGSDRLSEAELISQVELLLVAGHETTTKQIGNGMVALLGSPGQRTALRDNPDAAVEELLRHDPPGDGAQFRLAIEDVDVGGVRIPAGSAVLAAIPVANRDPRQFADADRLDLNRSANPHLTFGYGPHHCLGAILARAELKTTFLDLFARFGSLRLAVPPEELRWQRGLRVSGYAHVPVTW